MTVVDGALLIGRSVLTLEDFTPSTSVIRSNLHSANHSTWLQLVALAR